MKKTIFAIGLLIAELTAIVCLFYFSIHHYPNHIPKEAKYALGSPINK